MIAAAEEIGGWSKSVEVLPTSAVTVTEKRTSYQLSIAKVIESRFEVFETAIFNAVAFGLNKYIEHNPYYSIHKDSGYSILRYHVGHYYGEHSDSYTYDSEHIRILSILLYLNDSYEGGEIVFPRQNVKLKPEPGSMVIFPSMGTHPHKALTVTKGTKYVVVSWAR